MESPGNSPTDFYGSTIIRQTITPSTTQESIKSLSLRIYGKKGSPGPLRVSIQKSDGTVLEQVDIPASSISSSPAWITHTFSTPITLLSGQRYDLILSNPSGSSGNAYTIRGMKQGAFYGLFAGIFADGAADFSTNNGTSWQVFPAGEGERYDLQFYFQTSAIPPPPPTGNIYYISPTGSDSSGAGTFGSPWKTIAHAIPKLKPGDTLYARGGRYSGQYYQWSSPSGTDGSPITFAAYPGETPVFDGQSLDQWKRFLNLVGVDWIVVDGLTIKNYHGQGIWMGWDGEDFAEHITIRNNRLENIGTRPGEDHAIYVSWGNRDIVIENNFIKGVTGFGIHGWHAPGADGIKIINNIVRDAQSGGIVLGDGVTDIEICNNILYNNGAGMRFDLAGYDVNWGVQNAVFTNNLIVDSSVIGLRIGSFNEDDVFSDTNLYWDNTPSTILWDGQTLTLDDYRAISTNADNSIEADPLFVDPANDDFRLQPGSPAEAILGAGDCTSTPTPIPTSTPTNTPKLSAESPPLPASVCGNNDIESGEQCEGSNLDGRTCQNGGYKTGTLSCYAPGSSNECRFDVSACSGIAGLVPCGQLGNPCTLCDTFVLGQGILNIFLFPTVPIIAALLFAIGGFFLFTAAGSPQNLQRAKQIIIATVVGLLIIYGAWLFINLLLTTFGVADWTGLGTWWEIDCA